MNVVLVQHSGQQSKKYCFIVPDQLISHIKPGVRVICDTRIGNTPGCIVSEVLTGGDDDPEIQRMIAECGARIPLKSIIAVVKNIDISDVRIPIWMEMSKPRKDKLAKRKQELEDFGFFKTNVRIENGILRDGYTAYLVCKNRGMTTMPVAVYV